jgi:hypothetical protein
MTRRGDAMCKIMLGLLLAAIAALAVKEYPSIRRELKLMRM